MNALTALFRGPSAPELAPTMEARIDLLERRASHLWELSEEYHARLCDLETALERHAVPAGSVSA